MTESLFEFDDKHSIGNDLGNFEIVSEDNDYLVVETDCFERNAVLTKNETIDNVKKWIEESGFTVAEEDLEKPWGAYFRFKDEDVDRFLELFVPEEKNISQNKEVCMSPKFLLVAPEQRLSWQYHERRSEKWKVLLGDVGVKQNYSTVEPECVELLTVGQAVTLEYGDCHRLIGLDDWGLVAEIWIHIDKNNPSDENDIVRVSDDYSRV